MEVRTTVKSPSSYVHGFPRSFLNSIPFLPLSLLAHTETLCLRALYGGADRLS